MKRIIIAIIAACIAAGAAYAIFLQNCPETKKFDCEIKWLSHKLSLTPEQATRIRGVHIQHCPSMNGLRAQAKTCGDESKKAELKKACGESTNKLIEAVCAELDPRQREEYLKLIEARKNRGKALPEPKPAAQ